MLPFCEKCHDIVDFTVKEVEKKTYIKGKEISYLGRDAYCDECNSLLYVPEVHDYNLKKMNGEYAKLEDLVTIPEIKRALEIYKIGKRPLSFVLGWGETTLFRYLNGDMPTKQYSQTLRKIINDPNYMNELLEQNKDKISNIAYRTCKEAVEVLLKDKENHSLSIFGSNKKIDSVVQYILYKSEEITPLALQKLLYYAQSFHKVFYNNFLFEDECEAWIHGPVYRNVYEKYKMYGFNPIEEPIPDFKFDQLLENEKELLDSIIENFGCYSGKILENMTHVEQPWKEARQGLNQSEVSNRIIKKESIEKYFESVKVRYKMINIADIRDYSTDLFDKVHR